jgi:hypothetical protein
MQSLRLSNTVIGHGKSISQSPDNFLLSKMTYFYKIDCVSSFGKNTFVGPLGVTTKRLIGK